MDAVRGPFTRNTTPNSAPYTTFKMTETGTFTMILRVVVIRHFGGLLCAVGLTVSLFNFLRYIFGRVEF